jgi:hypothetical protein
MADWIEVRRELAAYRDACANLRNQLPEEFCDSDIRAVDDQIERMENCLRTAEIRERSRRRWASAFYLLRANTLRKQIDSRIRSISEHLDMSRGS